MCKCIRCNINLRDSTRLPIGFCDDCILILRVNKDINNLKELRKELLRLNNKEGVVWITTADKLPDNSYYKLGRREVLAIILKDGCSGYFLIKEGIEQMDGYFNARHKIWTILSPEPEVVDSIIALLEKYNPDVEIDSGMLVDSNGSNVIESSENRRERLEVFKKRLTNKR